MPDTKDNSIPSNANLPKPDGLKVRSAGGNPALQRPVRPVEHKPGFEKKPVSGEQSPKPGNTKSEGARPAIQRPVKPVGHKPGFEQKPVTGEQPPKPGNTKSEGARPAIQRPVKPVGHKPGLEKKVVAEVPESAETDKKSEEPLFISNAEDSHSESAETKKNEEKKLSEKIPLDIPPEPSDSLADNIERLGDEPPPPQTGRRNHPSPTLFPKTNRLSPPMSNPGFFLKLLSRKRGCLIGVNNISGLSISEPTLLRLSV